MNRLETTEENINVLEDISKTIQKELESEKEAEKINRASGSYKII